MHLYYADETKWGELTGSKTLDDYLRLDIRIAQKLFNDKLEIAVIGQNLTDKLHPEYSDGSVTHETDRLIYGQVTWYLR